MGLEPEEKIMSEKDTRGEIRKKEEKEQKKKDQSAEVPRGGSLYLPLDEFKELALSSSESEEELSPSEETDLEEKQLVMREKYQQDKMQANQSRKKPKVAGKGQLAARPLGSRLQGHSAPPPYAETPPCIVCQHCTERQCAERQCADSFIPREELIHSKEMQQAFPVFEGAESGRVHVPVEYIQIKELVGNSITGGP